MNHKELKEQAARRNVITEETEVEAAFSHEANNILRELGSEIGKHDAAVKHAKYLGSAAVHIYKTENLDTVFFIPQVRTLDNTTEFLASSAFTVLQNKMMSAFGRRERRGI